MTTTLLAVTTNPHWTGYRCVVCGVEYPRDWSRYVCDRCGIDGILDVQYDYASIQAGLDDREPFPEFKSDPACSEPVAGETGTDLWRYATLLPLRPVAASEAWSLGGTPLQAPVRLREQLDLPQLFLKDDTSLPSASLKDRATAVAIADAVRLGRDHLACASTGNAAASLAVLAARAGLTCTIFVPAAAPRAKLAQLLLHGAQVIRVAGNYDQAFALSLRTIADHGWYSRNCAHNPLLVEGKKTAALEVARTLAWRVPQAIFVPVGDGCIISSVAKAFTELRQIGLTDRIPRLYGVQATGAAPLARAWQKAGCQAGALEGKGILSLVEAITPRTLADSIAVGVPRNRVKAWQAVAASEGGFLTVTDEEITAAVALLARTAGLFAEPSGAAALAGLVQARRQGIIAGDESVVVLVTGHGLKDPGAALADLEIPEPVPPGGDE
jgi:threonine synthase